MGSLKRSFRAGLGGLSRKVKKDFPLYCAIYYIIRMRRIASETQLYAQLAHRGDPSAFYALFSGQIRDLYLLLRSQGKDHETACGEAKQRIAETYRRFVRSRPSKPDRWFAARCGLKRFDAAAAGTAASRADVAAYERLAVGSVNAAYSHWLDRDGDGSGDIVEKRTLVEYIVDTVTTVIVVGFLFFAQSVISVSFRRFGAEYRLSFPKIALELWDMSGLVRTDDGSWNKGDSALPAPQKGAEAKTRP